MTDRVILSQLRVLVIINLMGIQSKQVCQKVSLLKLCYSLKVQQMYGYSDGRICMEFGAMSDLQNSLYTGGQ